MLHILLIKFGKQVFIRLSLVDVVHAYPITEPCSEHREYVLRYAGKSWLRTTSYTASFPKCIQEFTDTIPIIVEQSAAKNASLS